MLFDKAARTCARYYNGEEGAKQGSATERNAGERREGRGEEKKRATVQWWSNSMKRLGRACPGVTAATPGLAGTAVARGRPRFRCDFSELAVLDARAHLFRIDLPCPPFKSVRAGGYG